MKRLSVSELAPESPVQSQFLVQSKERKISSNGSAYLDLELRDATGAIKAKVWDADRLRVEFEPGEVVRVEGRVDTYKGAPQIIIRTISRSRPEEVNLLDFLPRSLEDPKTMYARLLERLRRMPEGPLRKLLLSVVEDDGVAPKLKLAAIAGFPAGLQDQIEHILLSHHGKLEFGSPKEPAFPEALVVNYLDDLDSKLQSMRAQYAADISRPGDWTSRNRALGRELFKRPTKGGGKG